MSIIYSIIFASFLIATISAISAPPDVYSAIIINKHNSPVQCSIVWSEPSGTTLQGGLFTVPNKQMYNTGEQSVNMGTWSARKIIKEIHCGKLVLKAPFDGVTSPKTNWKFIVESDKIISGGYSSQIINY